MLLASGIENKHLVPLYSEGRLAVLQLSASYLFLAPAQTGECQPESAFCLQFPSRQMSRIE
jgi:hypothetical protein